MGAGNELFLISKIYRRRFLSQTLTGKHVLTAIFCNITRYKLQLL
jgi:hypothetical protein